MSETDFRRNDVSKRFENFDRKEHVDSFHLISRDSGLEFLFELDDIDFILDSVFIDKQKLKLFNLNELLGLPISFSSSRVDIRKILGNPIFESQLGERTMLGDVSPWDKCKFGDCFIHFEYEFDSASINIITLSIG